MGCVNAISAALKNLDGVIDADIDLVSSNAVVDYNENLVSIQDIKQVIVERGYKIIG